MFTLTLRFPEPGDAEPILEAVRESLPELCRWMTWCHPGYSEADAMQWIASQAQARETGSAFEFLIVGDIGRLLGVCGINCINTGIALPTSATGSEPPKPATASQYKR